MLAEKLRPVRRIPFTLVFLSLLVLANGLAGTFGGFLPTSALTAWGLSHHSLLTGEPFRLITGTYLSHDLGMALRQLGFAAVVIGLYEWIEGTRRAIILFYAIDILGSLLVLFGVLPVLVALPNTVTESELFVFDVGMSAGGFGLIGALAWKLRYRWAVLLVITVAILTKILISFDAIADTAHLLCLGLGVLGQALFLTQAPTRTAGARPPAPSRKPARKTSRGLEPASDDTLPTEVTTGNTRDS